MRMNSTNKKDDLLNVKMRLLKNQNMLLRGLIHNSTGKQHTNEVMINLENKCEHKYGKISNGLLPNNGKVPQSKNQKNLKNDKTQNEPKIDNKLMRLSIKNQQKSVNRNH